MISQPPIFTGVDMLRNATRYLGQQFRCTMTRDQAQANISARVLLLQLQKRVLDELEDKEKLRR